MRKLFLIFISTFFSFASIANASHHEIPIFLLKESLKPVDFLEELSVGTDPSQPLNFYKDVKPGDYASYHVDIKGTSTKLELINTVAKVTRDEATIKLAACYVLALNKKSCVHKEKSVALTKEITYPPKGLNAKITAQGQEKINVANASFETSWVEYSFTDKNGKEVAQKTWWIPQFPGVIKSEQNVTGGISYKMTLAELVIQ